MKPKPIWQLVLDIDAENIMLLLKQIYDCSPKLTYHITSFVGPAGGNPQLTIYGEYFEITTFRSLYLIDNGWDDDECEPVTLKP